MIGEIISQGIGSPAGITPFLTLGLTIGEPPPINPEPVVGPGVVGIGVVGTGVVGTGVIGD